MFSLCIGLATIIHSNDVFIALFSIIFCFCFFFFFQAEDGIRDYKVTGVQTCALPIWCLQNVMTNIMKLPVYEKRGYNSIKQIFRHWFVGIFHKNVDKRYLVINGEARPSSLWDVIWSAEPKNLDCTVFRPIVCLRKSPLEVGITTNRTFGKWLQYQRYCHNCSCSVAIRYITLAGTGTTAAYTSIPE